MSERKVAMTQDRELEAINAEQLTHEQIEKRAYEIYLNRSGEEGDALQDWLFAEEEVIQARAKETSVPLKAKAVTAGQPRS
jgi:hypothetical protein